MSAFIVIIAVMLFIIAISVSNKNAQVKKLNKIEKRSKENHQKAMKNFDDLEQKFWD